MQFSEKFIGYGQSLTSSSTFSKVKILLGKCKACDYGGVSIEINFADTLKSTCLNSRVSFKQWKEGGGRTS